MAVFRGWTATSDMNLIRTAARLTRAVSCWHGARLRSCSSVPLALDRGSARCSPSVYGVGRRLIAILGRGLIAIYSYIVGDRSGGCGNHARKFGEIRVRDGSALVISPIRIGYAYSEAQHRGSSQKYRFHQIVPFPSNA